MARHIAGSGNQRSLQRRTTGVQSITVQVHHEFNITLDLTHVEEEGAVSAHVLFFKKNTLLTPKTIEIAVNNRTRVVQTSSINIEPSDYYFIADNPKKCVVNFTVTANLSVAPGDLKKKHSIVFEIEDQHHVEAEHGHDEEEETLQHFKDIKAEGTHRSEHITIEKIQLIKKK